MKQQACLIIIVAYDFKFANYFVTTLEIYLHQDLMSK